MAFFLIIGVLGFIIDYSILSILKFYFNLNIVYLRFISYFIASIITWYLHRHFTFVDSNSNIFFQFLKYISANIIGSIINIFIFILFVKYSFYPFNDLFFSILISSFVAMFYSYFSYRFIVFRKKDKLL